MRCRGHRPASRAAVLRDGGGERRHEGGEQLRRDRQRRRERQRVAADAAGEHDVPALQERARDGERLARRRRAERRPSVPRPRTVHDAGRRRAGGGELLDPARADLGGALGEPTAHRVDRGERGGARRRRAEMRPRVDRRRRRARPTLASRARDRRTRRWARRRRALSRGRSRRRRRPRARTRASRRCAPCRSRSRRARGARPPRR